MSPVPENIGTEDAGSESSKAFGPAAAGRLGTSGSLERMQDQGSDSGSSVGMARCGTLISGLLFYAPIDIVLSAIPQAPDYTVAIGWVFAAVMIGAALVLALFRAKAQREAATPDALP